MVESSKRSGKSTSQRKFTNYHPHQRLIFRCQGILVLGFIAMFLLLPQRWLLVLNDADPKSVDITVNDDETLPKMMGWNGC
jgi:hypothetical protein